MFVCAMEKGKEKDEEDGQQYGEVHLAHETGEIRFQVDGAGKIFPEGDSGSGYGGSKSHGDGYPACQETQTRMIYFRDEMIFTA